MNKEKFQQQQLKNVFVQIASYPEYTNIQNDVKEN